MKQRLVLNGALVTSDKTLEELEALDEVPWPGPGGLVSLPEIITKTVRVKRVNSFGEEEVIEYPSRRRLQQIFYYLCLYRDYHGMLIAQDFPLPGELEGILVAYVKTKNSFEKSHKTFPAQRFIEHRIFIAYLEALAARHGRGVNWIAKELGRSRSTFYRVRRGDLYFSFSMSDLEKLFPLWRAKWDEAIRAQAVSLGSGLPRWVYEKYYGEFIEGSHRLRVWGRKEK